MMRTFYTTPNNILGCYKSTRILCQELLSNSDITRLTRLNHVDIYDNTLFIEFIRPNGCEHDVFGMMISFPVNIIGNRGSFHGEGVPSTVEIILLGKTPDNSNIFNSVFIKDKSCGYDGVRHFYEYNINCIVEEITRISDYMAYPYLKDLYQLDN